MRPHPPAKAGVLSDGLLVHGQVDAERLAIGDIAVLPLQWGGQGGSVLAWPGKVAGEGVAMPSMAGTCH